MSTATLNTPLGLAFIEGDEKGIARISVSGEAPTDMELQFSTHNINSNYNSEETTSVTAEVPQELQEAVSQLQEYFAGARNQFSFKIAPKGTDFQKKVWEALLNIPFGKTLSYLSLAKELGDMKAIRAVASANGKNPLWIVVPCHRVIGTDGSLTGYTGGLWRKKWLLDHENPPKQTSLF